MNIEQEKMIVEALPSLYPLKDYEEDAIHTVLEALPHWIPVPERVTEESKERTCRVEYHNVDGRIEEIPVCCSTCEHYVYFSGYEVLCRKYKGNQRFGYSITGDAYQKCLYKDWTWKGH